MGEPEPPSDKTCGRCVHLRYVEKKTKLGEGEPLPGTGDFACPAFPRPGTIPFQIFCGDEPHLKPWPGQRGNIVFTPGFVDPFTG